MMNADQLRETYNRYFSNSSNKWSSTNQRETLKIAQTVLIWLRELGLKESDISLLDVGCGTGYFTQAFSRLGLKPIGLDYSDVALKKASETFPDIAFIQMNGFEPQLDSMFDIIFCRGFSGTNTHDLDFIANWMNRYIPYLNPGGFFVLGYSSDFSGKELEGETVNHSLQELNLLSTKIQVTYKGLKVFSYLGMISVIKRWFFSRLLNRQQKVYYYLFFTKEP
jgi:SAM-dependent methyltransferase